MLLLCVCDRSVLQAMLEELAGKVGHRDQLIAPRLGYLKTLDSVVVLFNFHEESNLIRTSSVFTFSNLIGLMLIGLFM